MIHLRQLQQRGRAEAVGGHVLGARQQLSNRLRAQLVAYRKRPQQVCEVCCLRQRRCQQCSDNMVLGGGMQPLIQVDKVGEVCCSPGEAICVEGAERVSCFKGQAEMQKHNALILPGG